MVSCFVNESLTARSTYLMQLLLIERDEVESQIVTSRYYAKKAASIVFLRAHSSASDPPVSNIVATTRELLD